MIFRILCLLLTVAMHPSFIAQDHCKFSQLHSDLDSPDILQIMTYNAYWLYDREDDPNVEYDQKYKPGNYETKLSGAAQVINRHRPDVIALQEVENRGVLEDLLTYLDRPMEILHYDSMDSFTGQDVALLYNFRQIDPQFYLKK